MAWITWGDMVESAYKVRQRGAGYLLGKLRLSPQARTRATWNAQAQASANWWSIPAIRERWNQRITGHAGTSYEPWLAQHYAVQYPQCRVLSIGCGNGSHEMLLAQQPHIHSVTGIDLSPVKIAEARQAAQDAGISNVSFVAGDLFGIALQGPYDMVLFHSSLHHFRELEKILGELVPSWLSPNGLLVLFEFVGPTRFQWTAHQLDAANQLLQSMPHSLRTRIGSTLTKNRIYRPGILRMRINDPSESVRSADIMPMVNRLYHTEYQVSLGGTLLQLVLQDISHHFVQPDSVAADWLQQAFSTEDRFEQETGQVDFIFGIYRPS